MESERQIVQYVLDSDFESLPTETVEFVKELILGVLGTTIAGVNEEECKTVVDLVKEWGGREEATILLDGAKVPAHNAAYANSVLARVLDYEDGLPPGVHFTASIVPTALAAAEVSGACTGKDFLAAVTLGSEVTAKLNACSFYEGFDPTGIVGIFGATAAAGRVMKLNSNQMWDALGLAFNRAGGSFQCNIDGALAVRAIQGFVSQGAISCVQLAMRGITGPRNFIEGVYGFLHLFGKDRYGSEKITEGLGKSYLLHNTLCKKFPSCGCTLTSTEAVLEIMNQNNLTADKVASVEVALTPYCYNLVGHPFTIGKTPSVDAQFNVQYCVANAILRNGSNLEHFTEPFIKDPDIMKFADKIVVRPDQVLQKEGEEASLAAAVEITSVSGDKFHKRLDIGRGMKGNPLSKEEHVDHFRECCNYADGVLSEESMQKTISFIDRIEEEKDISELISQLAHNENVQKI